MYLAIYRWKTSIFLWRNNRRLWLTIIPCGFLGSFFDKKQGKFCQNLVALFPFAAKIVGAQKNPLQSVQSPQNQCQKILISVVPDKRKHTYKANYTYFPFFGRFWVRVWCVAVDWVSLIWLFSRFWTREYFS